MDTTGNYPEQNRHEKLPSVTREELKQNVDTIMEQIEIGENPILICDEGRADLLAVIVLGLLIYFLVKNAVIFFPT